MRGNTVTIEMSEKRGKMAKTIPLYQYDYGQKLIIENVELPVAYEVHFSNELHGESVTSIGDSTGVDIPDQFLTTGKNIYLWLFLHDGESDGETEYAGVIPVIKRAEPTDEEPTPEQQSTITQTIAALNAAVELAEDAEENIKNMGVSASTLGEGQSATVTKTVDPVTGAVSLEFGIPVGATGEQGEPGSQGSPGQDGVSPSVAVSTISGGHKVSVTDATGTKTFNVMDGEKGDPGDPGEPGDPTELIDDEAGEGDIDKVWSADKSHALLTEINTVKDDPIPSAVKTALLALAENVAYATNQGPSVYNALAGALYNEVWPVTNTLSHCTSSNSSQSVTKNGSYSASITADTDYTLTGATVLITMGGVDITSTAYSNGTISIASVTGVLSISITAEAETPTVGYVTDGLVAYWDGIDNTENGHSASTTTWEDLIGSYDLTMNSVGGTWDTNAITFNGTAYNGMYRDNLWTFSSNATIEVVLDPASGSSTMGVATFDRAATPDPTYYDARRFSLYSDNTIGFVGKGGKTYTNAAGQITNIKKLVATYSGFTVVKAFANNEQLSLGNNQHSFTYSGDQQMRVGDVQFSENAYPFNGKIYAIRVYNRHLTDDEITQNFNYDNQRFSLGVS